MNWLDLLRNIINRKGKTSPRVGIERYEETIYIGQQNLNDLIRKIAEQEQRSPEDIASEIFSHTFDEYAHFQEILVKWQILSRREQEVTLLICLGNTNEEIAQKLFISLNTVKVHVRNILFKFQANSKDHLRQMLKDLDFRSFGT